jgi:hypothetical protein
MSDEARVLELIHEQVVAELARLREGMTRLVEAAAVGYGPISAIDLAALLEVYSE